MAACVHPQTIYVITRVVSGEEHSYTFTRPVQPQPGDVDRYGAVIDYSRAISQYNVRMRRFEASRKNAKEYQVPCNKCVACLRNRAAEWSARCVDEASLYDHNLFVTFTYDREYLPPDGSLNKSHFRQFMHKLRKHCAAHSMPSPRYFMSGEYGTHSFQPHYHAIIFNLHMQDLRFHHKDGNSGFDYYDSPTLTGLWGMGFLAISSVTPATCAYVARYVSKKLTKSSDIPDIMFLKYGDPSAGFIRCPKGSRIPEYSSSSTHPGIGAGFVDKYHHFIYPSGVYVRDNGKAIGRAPMPRYYRDRAYYVHGEDTEATVDGRMAFAKARVERENYLAGSPDGYARTLEVSEYIQMQHADRLNRGRKL